MTEYKGAKSKLLVLVSFSLKGKSGLVFCSLQPPMLHALLEGCPGETVGLEEHSP